MSGRIFSRYPQTGLAKRTSTLSVHGGRRDICSVSSSPSFRSYSCYQLPRHSTKMPYTSIVRAYIPPPSPLGLPGTRSYSVYGVTIWPDSWTLGGEQKPANPNETVTDTGIGQAKSSSIGALPNTTTPHQTPVEPVQPLKQPPTDPAPPDLIVDETIQEFIPEVAQQALPAITKLGDLAALGLGRSTPTGLCERLLELIHVTTGLPWWGTIVLSTLTIRFILFPLIVYQQRGAARMNNIRPELEKLTERRKRASLVGDEAEKMQAMQDSAVLFGSAGVNPLVMLVPTVVQGTVFVSFFFAVQAMCSLPVPGFQNGGVLWFTDLTTHDPYYVLPIVASVSMMGVLETMTGAPGAQSAAHGAAVKSAMRVAVLVGCVFTSSFPAGVFMYWTASNAFTFASVFLLRQPSVKKYFEIPETIHHAVKTNTSGLIKKASRTDVYQMVDDVRKRLGQKDGTNASISSIRK
ncbi:hypothetical protein SeMB42_g00133 [Synchytrium endobioticum]|uniref:Membrane insertase YidC/Oxa/ALB C-terminal domain-containing protein n=1 Tax=Synchytrium endobioticum TaxID=286115 RepID=A0A507DUI7_9FUNG|nr:hypothetical protein SeMB42_g00133 [Synchytrium endobioticum]